MENVFVLKAILILILKYVMRARFIALNVYINKKYLII
jgi:hypothetical protein